MEIGNQIRRLRLRKDVTQEAMAHHLGVTPQAVSKWERNSALPDISLIPALSAYFGVTIDELFAVSDDTRVERIQNMIWDERYFDPAVVENERKFLLEKAKREPENDTYHELLADIEMHLAKEHMELAEEYSREALRRNPNNPDALFSLVQSMGGVCRDWYAANHHLLIDFCKEFIAEHPRNWRAYMWLMDHLLIDCRIEEAKAYFDEFTAVDDSYRTELYWGKLLWYTGNQEGAMAVWQKMQEDAPDQWNAWLHIGNMMAQTGNYEAAKENYRKALEMQSAPRYLDALDSIAQICEVQNDLPGAIAAWQEELEYLDREWHCTTGETADVVRREIARLQKKL